MTKDCSWNYHENYKRRSWAEHGPCSAHVILLIDAKIRGSDSEILDFGGDKKVIQYEKSEMFYFNFNLNINCFEKRYKLKLRINDLLTRLLSNKGFFLRNYFGPVEICFKRLEAKL